MMEWIQCWSISMWIHFSLSSSVNTMLLTSTLSNVEYFCSCWRWGLCHPHRPQDKSERETWTRLGNVCSCVEMIKIISPYIAHNESVGTLLEQPRSPLIMKHWPLTVMGLLDYWENWFLLWLEWSDLLPDKPWARLKLCLCLMEDFGLKCGREDGSWGCV